MNWRSKLFAVDTGLALLLVFLSATLLLRAYAAAARESKKGDLLGQALQIGKRALVIRSFGRCVGRFEQQLEDESDLISFHGEGVLTLSVNGVPSRASLNVLGTFNALGQLGAGGVALEAPQFSARIALQNIDPVEITLRVAARDRNFEQRLSIPGPIELQRLGLHTYRLRHGRFRLLENAGHGLLGDFVRAKLRLSVEEARPGECEGELTALELAPLAEAMADLSRGLAPLLPGVR